MARQIKRSSTGKYHIGSTGSTHADCNQRMYTSPTTIAMALNAPSDMFCEKCFGKHHHVHDRIKRSADLGYFNN